MERLGNVCILGLGLSGRAAAEYCADRLGDQCESVTLVETSDTAPLREAAKALTERGVVVVLGSESVPRSCDVCIASPGVPPHSPLMLSAREKSARVISEIEFAFERSESPWVAITGTNGKTTTTALVAHLLREGGSVASAVGNIGSPAIEAVARAMPGEILVAEVSSFQLALTDTFHPRVAVLLNVTPDHIDWHGSLEAYAQDKARVFANLGPDDVAVVDLDDPISASWAQTLLDRGLRVMSVTRAGVPAAGAGVDGGVLMLADERGRTPLLDVDEMLIRGPHNVSNALAAAAAAHAMGIHAADIARGISAFEPIEHRLEPAGTACGADWYNDSKATNPDAVIKALAAFEGRGVVLLLGGRSKGSDFAELVAQAASRTRSVICFGEAGPTMAAAFGGMDVDVSLVATMEDAVRRAADAVRPGDTVLLSPACASFDEYSNYQERGRAFKTLVSSLECGNQ